MSARHLVAFLLVAEMVGGFLLMAWLVPTPPRGALLVHSFFTSYHAMEPLYVYASWLCAAGAIFVAALLDDDLWRD